VSYLRDVIAARDEEIRRRDAISSQLTNRILGLEPLPKTREVPL
jgi:hypothetical protein